MSGTGVRPSKKFLRAPSASDSLAVFLRETFNMEQITKAAEKIGLADNKEPEPEPEAAAADTPPKTSKKADKKEDRKAKRKEAKSKKEGPGMQSTQGAAQAGDAADVSEGMYGKMGLMQSKNEDRKRENRVQCFNCL